MYIYFLISLVNTSSFIFQTVIGKGSFGKVWLATHKKTSLPSAIKEISKEKILLQKFENSIIQEKNILSSFNSK